MQFKTGGRKERRNNKIYNPFPPPQIHSWQKSQQQQNNNNKIRKRN